MSTGASSTESERVVPGSLREPRERQRPSELVAGYLSALAIFVSLVALAWHTLRLSPAAMVLAVVGAAMAGRNKRLALAAMLIAAFCFFLGMTLSVLVSRPLW